MSILETIHGHQQLSDLNEEQRKQLCVEIRDYLIENLSKTGGHVASNLGVVELTVALETVYNTQTDRLVFDVGHQSYVHKLLTDRWADFSTMRQLGGLAGFPKPAESESDAFVAGHASSSVSIALGMAKARTLMGDDYQVVALMGDGAATGGMAYEGLCNAAVSGEPLVVVLNDNAMSIDRNVGGMASHLRKLRTKERYLGMKARYRNFLTRFPGGKGIYNLTRKLKDRLRRMLIPSTIFENMGFAYLGPVDGHDVENLIFLLRTAKDMKRPVVLHVMTQKGKGYEPAQNNPRQFHGIGKFDPKTGELLTPSGRSFSNAFGDSLCKLAEKDPRVCAITAAMPSGTGLLGFKERFPERLFDVGIAEEHAVSMAGGLAKQGMVPVVALYSTFLQRAYDQILQDISMLGLHVVLAVDRAGLVGEDGETHHGIYDVGFLRHAPGLTVLSPSSYLELESMLSWAILEQSGPVAIRFPRGSDDGLCDLGWSSENRVSLHRKGTDATIVTYGNLLKNALDAADILATQGVETTVLRMTSLQPMPVDELLANAAPASLIVVMEEVDANCGIYQALAYEIGLLDQKRCVRGINLGHRFVQHGTVAQLRALSGLDPDSVANYVQEVLKNEN